MMRLSAIISITVLGVLLFILCPSVSAQRYQKIDTAVTDALKRSFKADYGYEWEEASEQVQQSYFTGYNRRVKKERILERRREQMERQRERREAQIKKMQDRREIIKQKQREMARIREDQNKDRDRRKLREKMKLQMRKLQEMRKQSDRR